MSKYKRVMVKLSGEMLGESSGGIDAGRLQDVCRSLKEVIDEGIQIALVIGGGNFWRFKDQKELVLDRVVSDTMGMLATVMNALAVREELERIGVRAKAYSSLRVPGVLKEFMPRCARNSFADHDVVLCAGGTGNPYFTTDSAAALRALELKCDLLLKATKVDFVCDRDPKKHADAKTFEELSYQQVLEMGLEVMDLSAISLCMENALPILVFNMNGEGNLLRAARGERVGTLIS
jgi:uridylate kinase